MESFNQTLQSATIKQGAIACCSILFTSILLLKLYKKNNNKQTVVLDQPNKEEEETKFPDDWNELLKNCFLESYNDIVCILNDKEKCTQLLYKVDKSKWNVLHVIVSKGNKDILDLLLNHLNQQQQSNSNNNNNNNEDLINQKNDKGYTPLHIASCNGFNELVDQLLGNGAKIDMVSDSLETPLYLACANQYQEIVRSILLSIPSIDDRKVYINRFTTHGTTALHVSVLRKNLELIKLLLVNGADTNMAKKDGSTALHIASTIDYPDVIPILFEHGADIKLLNRFGNTPLHDACINGNSKIVKVILDKYPLLVDLKDNDGSTPLHLACNVVNKDVSKYRLVINVLLEHGVNVNSVDDGHATALHVLACQGESAVNSLVEYLLENGANPTISNVTGWTALHHAHNQKNESLLELLVQHCQKFHPEFLETFDKDKPRAIRERTEKLLLESGEERLAKIARDIASGKIKNIVTLTGAGISVSAGIPAYRTEDGLYNRQKMRLSFSMQSIHEEPETFFEAIKHYFYPVITGEIVPTKSHEFIHRLHCKQLLLRNFTQNVDLLDERAGIPDDKIVHAHGSLASWRCSGCNEPQDNDRVWREIARDGLPYCNAPHCRNIIRPDVVFFGEGLPVRYQQQSILDLRQCDLLIVMGSSLSVYPFASLTNDVSSHIPRILINRDAVGPFRGVSDLNHPSTSTNPDNENQSQQQPTSSKLIIESRGTRDTVILGNCDDGVNYLENVLFK